MPKKTDKALEKAPNPQLVSVRKRADALLKAWKAPLVRSAEDFEAAGVAVRDFAALRKELQAILNPEIKAAKAAYDEKRDAFKAVDAIIAEGEHAIRYALEAYNAAHEKAKQARVERALSRGDDEKAAAIAATPYVPKVEGVSFRETWHAEVTDMGVLLSAILDGRAPIDAVEPAESWLNAQARARKSEDLGIPGVKGVKETSSSVRA